MFETVIKEVFNPLTLGKTILSGILSFLLVAFLYPRIGPLGQNELLICFFVTLICVYSILSFLLNYGKTPEEKPEEKLNEEN